MTMKSLVHVLWYALDVCLRDTTAHLLWRSVGTQLHYTIPFDWYTTAITVS